MRHKRLKQIAAPTTLATSNLPLIIAGIVFVLVGIFLPKTQSRNEDGHGSITQIVTVAITKDGFSPDYILIKSGTMVRWINNDSTPHWPASDSHPTHAMYPSATKACGSDTFDACKALLTKQTYSFTFHVNGVWGAHDHLSPGTTMAIEVGPLSSTAGLTAIKTITNLFNREAKGLPRPTAFQSLNRAQQRGIILKLTKTDPNNAWSYLKVAGTENGQTVGSMHEFAHIVGNALYKSNGIDAITSCDRTFSFGCFHGVTEAALKANGINTISNIERACLKIFPATTTVNAMNCIHGVGHGVLAMENYDHVKALNDCNLLSPEYQRYCYDGVFMEYAAFAPKSKYAMENIWQFCTDLDPQLHVQCAQQQPVMLRYQYKVSFEETIPFCEQAPAAAMVTGCFRNLGQLAATDALGNADKIREACGQITTEYGKRQCLLEAAASVAFQQYVHWQQTSKEVCESEKVPWANECLAYVQQVVARYDIAN